MTDLLSKEHTILEKGPMELRPFGNDPSGHRIRDVSGVGVLANVEYLEELVDRKDGPEEGKRAVEQLVKLLNERIRDQAYHVTSAFLKNQWNSYSYEFLMFMAEFCAALSGNPRYHFDLGKEKFISPIIRTLGRPFTVSQIYTMLAHFAAKYAEDSLKFDVVEVKNGRAIIRMRFSERIYREFGPYRKACIWAVCQSTKAAISAVPERVHKMKTATVTDLTCIAEGDEYCEWEVLWKPQENRHYVWRVAGVLAGGGTLSYLRVRYPEMSAIETGVFTLFPIVGAWLASFVFDYRAREQIIQEQVNHLDARSEDLREANLEQERTTVELKRKVMQLTTLHNAGLIFNSTLDRDALLQSVLEAILHDLHYDRAMISFYDPVERVSRDARILGVSNEIAAFVRGLKTPVTDPDTVEGMVLLQGKPTLASDIREVWDRLHPNNQRLAELAKAKSIISVPLKVKGRIIGALTVDRMQENSLNADDLELMLTVANQAAIALDNAQAYSRIEELNVGLEEKVRDRTKELEIANVELKEWDHQKSLFLSHVSHELRSPLTAIKGLVENMLSGLTGPLDVKQETYLDRVNANANRLLRMISNLLDQSRLEFKKMELSLEDVDLSKLLSDVVENLRPLAVAKRQQIDVIFLESGLIVRADWDKLIQIVTNLLDNAIKYTAESGHIKVEVAREGTQFAKISVIDSGDGIDPATLPSLFNQFFRIKRQGEKRKEGFGLGLSIVKALVELHGGNISVKSQVGKGSAFQFTILLTSVAVEKEGERNKENKRVLVVDDDQDIRQMLLDRLRFYGYIVDAARDGREALSMLRTVSFDGVLLDIGMPEMDGFEVLLRLRELHATLPVIMITASGSKDRAIEAVSKGAQDYLLKPFDAGHLKDVMERYFGAGGCPP